MPPYRYSPRYKRILSSSDTITTVARLPWGLSGSTKAGKPCTYNVRHGCASAKSVELGKQQAKEKSLSKDLRQRKGNQGMGAYGLLGTTMGPASEADMWSRAVSHRERDCNRMIVLPPIARHADSPANTHQTALHIDALNSVQRHSSCSLAEGLLNVINHVCDRTLFWTTALVSCSGVIFYLTSSWTAGFWKRHRRKVYLTLGVFGSGYLAYKLYDSHRRRLSDLERQLAGERENEELIKAQMQAHFENIQRIADATTLPHSMGYLSSRVAEELDLSHLTERLIRGKGQPNTMSSSEKLELWDKLKILISEQ
ncbi:peroxin 3 [Actinidia rufa]|uniref:Peroxin 3 n=1 Tax=Actinidia rufa TaxID=165716 RepID=A0A7J0GLH1_9ERIC|nr:peroxin 3 [Actinidia rufa]